MKKETLDISKYFGLVRHIAYAMNHHTKQTYDVEDLIGYGMLGLCLAKRDFKRTKGAKFSTYAYLKIKGAILDGLRVLNWQSSRASIKLTFVHIADLNVSDIQIILGEEAYSGGGACLTPITNYWETLCASNIEENLQKKQKQQTAQEAFNSLCKADKEAITNHIRSKYPSSKSWGSRLYRRALEKLQRSV